MLMLPIRLIFTDATLILFRITRGTEIMERSKDEQIRAIEHSFDSVNDAEKLKKLKHPTKTDVHVEEIVPLFPDSKEMDMALTYCSFNTDPFEGAEERLQTVSNRT
jgi:hypothetical protein